MKTKEYFGRFFKYLKSVPPVIYFITIETVVYIVLVSNFILTSEDPVLELHWIIVSFFGLVAVIILIFIGLLTFVFSWGITFLILSWLEFLFEENTPQHNFFKRLCDKCSFFIAYFLGF